ncbi:MAG: hypothetical protein KDK70_35295, partial [Myxococcales bacterium]|nr:hypothetical protein [Myxococcales bacterium]
MLPALMDLPGLRWLARLRASPRLRAAAPWVGLLLLDAAFVLPAVAQQLPRQPLLALVPSGDLLLAVTACVATAHLRHGVWVRRAVLLLLMLSWLYMWPAMIGQIVIRQAPLLYDLLFLAKHVGILVMDLWTWTRFAALLGGLLAVVVVGWLGLRLFGAVVAALAARPWRHRARVGIPALVVLAALSLAHDRRHVVGVKVTGPLVWTTPALLANLGASIGMYRRIQRGIA